MLGGGPGRERESDVTAYEEKKKKKPTKASSEGRFPQHELALRDKGLPLLSSP